MKQTFKSQILALFLFLSFVIGFAPSNAIARTDTKIQNKPTQLRTPSQDGLAEDITVGIQAKQRLFNANLKLVKDQKVQDYIHRIGSELVAGMEDQYQHEGFNYEFFVIDSMEHNAFCLPGGKIFVFKGLIINSMGEGQLKGILAHEIGHAVFRHSVDQQMPKWSVFAMLGAAVLGDKAGGKAEQAIMVGASIAFRLVELKYSREDEKEADIFAAQLLAKNNIDPMSLANAFRWIDVHIGSGSEFLSSHPNPANRDSYITREAGLMQLAGWYNPRTVNFMSKEFLPIQTSLKK